MNRIKYYRYLKVLFGWRSFTKTGKTGAKIYLMIKGRDLDRFVEALQEDGYIEEWPLS